MTGADIQAILDRIPYTQFIGVEPLIIGDELSMVLRYKPTNIGNPFLPALHGGVIGGFMEVTAIAALMFSGNHTKVPKPVGLNIAYLRSGKPQDCFARADIVRQGARVANVLVKTWQDNLDEPIAHLSGNYLTADTNS